MAFIDMRMPRSQKPHSQRVRHSRGAIHFFGLIFLAILIMAIYLVKGWTSELDAQKLQIQELNRRIAILESRVDALGGQR